MTNVEMALPKENRAWVRVQFRETGLPQTGDLELQTLPIPDLAAGQFLVKVEAFSVDPYLRGFLRSSAYGMALKLNEVMHSTGVGKVLASKNDKFAVGSRVVGSFGWQEFAVSSGANVDSLPSEGANTHALGTLGMPGLTAYLGLFNITSPKPGEVVFVSAGAGAVGSVVGQLAKIAGCKVYGSASSDDKVAFMVNDLGFDGAVNYTGKDAQALAAEIKKVTGRSGIDVYFENSGGVTTDAVLENLNAFARVSVCGQIATYNLDDKSQVKGTPHFLMLLSKRATARGFLVTDFTTADKKAALRHLASFVAEGKLKVVEAKVQGLENAFSGWLDLYVKRDNIGKKVIVL